MKKIYIHILFILVSLSVYSQNITENDLLNVLKSGDAIKAKSLSDKAIEQPNASNDAYIWFYRGQIYLALFASPDKQIQNLAPDALEIAYNAFKKVIELDKNKKYNKETLEALQSIANQFNYEGVHLFNQQQYEKAYQYFENAISISKMPAINKIDTIIYYNAALAAEKCNKINVAIDLYEKLKQFKFGGANIYLELGKIYCDNKFENKGIEIYKQGMSLFPDEKIKFLNELINFYLKTNNINEAFTYTEEALKIDKNNPSLYFIKGSLLEQMNNEQEAEKMYLKALEINPIYQDALYNLGAMYYNRATTMIKKAMNKTEQNQAIEIYTKAQTFLETYNNNFQREEIILKMLKTIYTLTNQTDKLNQVNEWLKSF